MWFLTLPNVQSSLVVCKLCVVVKQIIKNIISAIKTGKIVSD